MKSVYPGVASFIKNSLCLGMHCSKIALQPIEEVLDQNAFFYRFCVFLYKNVVRIQQSIQKWAFRIRLENDKKALIQTDEIR